MTKTWILALIVGGGAMAAAAAGCTVTSGAVALDDSGIPDTGTGGSGGDDSGTDAGVDTGTTGCAQPVITGYGSACDLCVETNCCPQILTCSAPDDGGTIQCDQYALCAQACDEAGAPLTSDSGPTCYDSCASAYPLFGAIDQCASAVPSGSDAGICSSVCY
jgi:hypothetical protein